MIRALISLFMSYVIAAPLTDKISMDLSRTEWGNAWTYAIWLCSFWIWFGFLCVLIGAGSTLFRGKAGKGSAR